MESGASNEPVFKARSDNVQAIHDILSTISYKKDQIVSCKLSDSGLKVTYEAQSKSLQAHAFLQSSLFQSLHVSPDATNFRVTLNVLLECLNIFGSKWTTLFMSYGGQGHPLILILEENNVITDCHIRTMDCEDPLEFSFRATKVVVRVILQSDILREALLELSTMSDSVLICLNSNPQVLKLVGESSTGSCEFEFPASSDVMEAFECDDSVEVRYRFSLVQPCLRALALSVKTSLRINEQGILSLQHMIRREEQSNFVEFFVAPDEEDSDDENYDAEVTHI